jgi:CheY-like chemotaxis protein
LKILILEDNPDRIKKFKRRLIGNVVTIVETAQEAIDRLREDEWDLLSLDHDLGGEEMVPSGPGTGWEVAKWLETNPERKPGRILLHSFNGPGRANMLACLPGAEDCPGWWLN